MNTQQFRSAIDQRKGKRDQIQNQIDSTRLESQKLRREHRLAERAKILIQTVAQQTQEELKYQLSELPKLALQGVFDDPYDFEVAIELRRGKTEADFWFVRDGQRLNPKKSTGLGSVDIAGTALRAALWSLKRPRNRPIIFLDEPFKHLKGQETNIRALAMLKEICKPRPEQNWPGLQIIMIADERASRDDLELVADKIFEFSIKNRETKVK